MGRKLRIFLIALAAVCFAVALYAPVSRFFENKSLDDGMDELRQMKQKATEAEGERAADFELNSLLSDSGAPSAEPLETDRCLYSDDRAPKPSAEAKTAPAEPVSEDAAAKIEGLPVASDTGKASKSNQIQTSVGIDSQAPITDRSLVSAVPLAAETGDSAANGPGIAPVATPMPAQTPPASGTAPVGTAPIAGVQATPNPELPSGGMVTDQSLYQANPTLPGTQSLLPASPDGSIPGAVPTAKILPVLPGVSPSATPAVPMELIPSAAPHASPESTPLPMPSPTPFVFIEDNILPEYRDLYEQNADLVGWLKIDGTLIDYPVLQSDDEEFYLKRDFFGRKNYNGQLILDANCDPFTPSVNLVISGHNMKSGKMFGRLQYYASSGYAQKHPIIAFDTLFRKGEYKVVAAFYTWDYTARPDGFQYNVNIEYRRQLTAFLQKLDEIKLYDTGVSVEFGDELIMLSTCSYQTGDGRFVVVARRLRAGEEG